ncbi:MAG: 5-formyltetrahydrofolate cyclo-ligase [Helicobacteraceae bacterium]|jgi:5-formyltetrahydrofolate cyclo-ligase|nr:5-formyltetrahydrofolate cyclo-ligase [Helicobacteraceae bacterium]
MDKNDIRTIALEKLKSRSKAQCAAQSAKTRKNLAKLLKKLRFKSVIIYLPLWFEADLRPLFRALRGKAKLYAPFAQGVSFKALPYRLPLSRQSLGIFAPANSLREIKKTDVLIAPTVAVDASFARIGFGKGMYDRFVCGLVKKPIVIFVQPFFLGAPKVSDAWDLRGDYLASGNRVICNLGNRYDSRIYCRRISFRSCLRGGRLVGYEQT